jgi:hypothetical protein
MKMGEDDLREFDHRASLPWKWTVKIVAMVVLIALSWLLPISLVAKEPTLAEAIATIREATARFQEIEQAKREGYRQYTPMLRDHGYHFFNPSIVEFDLRRPSVLLYVRQGERWQLTGVEYVASGSQPPPSLIPGAPWHEHEASCHYADGSELPASVGTECLKRHPVSGAAFTAWHPSLHQLHVWAWYPNPSGLFAATNALLAPYGGVQGVAGGATGHGSTKRTPAQIAFSEFNHNSAGVLLIVIGIAAVAEVLIPGRSLTRSLWPLTAIGTSLYIIFRSDPRVWPMGPIPLWEGLKIPSVWQHKTGGLILLAIGLIELLRRRGRLQHPAWGYLFPCLAIAGGAMLLLLHSGHSAGLLLAFISQQLIWGLAGFKIYLQHATMGILALLLGGTKLLWDRDPEKRNRPLVWRVLMILFGLLLLFYSET